MVTDGSIFVIGEIPTYMSVPRRANPTKYWLIWKMVIVTYVCAHIWINVLRLLYDLPLLFAVFSDDVVSHVWLNEFTGSVRVVVMILNRVISVPQKNNVPLNKMVTLNIVVQLNCSSPFDRDDVRASHHEDQKTSWRREDKQRFWIWNLWW